MHRTAWCRKRIISRSEACRVVQVACKGRAPDFADLATLRALTSLVLKPAPPLDVDAVQAPCNLGALTQLVSLCNAGGVLLVSWPCI